MTMTITQWQSWHKKIKGKENSPYPPGSGNGREEPKTLDMKRRRTVMNEMEIQNSSVSD